MSADHYPSGIRRPQSIHRLRDVGDEIENADYLINRLLTALNAIESEAGSATMSSGEMVWTVSAELMADVRAVLEEASE